MTVHQGLLPTRRTCNHWLRSSWSRLTFGKALRGQLRGRVLFEHLLAWSRVHHELHPRNRPVHLRTGAISALALGTGVPPTPSVKPVKDFLAPGLRITSSRPLERPAAFQSSSSTAPQAASLRFNGEMAGLLILQPHDLEVSPLTRNQNVVPAIGHSFWRT